MTIAKFVAIVKFKGGQGSGNFDHCGRPGQQGGSQDCQGGGKHGVSMGGAYTIGGPPPGTIVPRGGGIPVSKPKKVAAADSQQGAVHPKKQPQPPPPVKGGLKSQASFVWKATEKNAEWMSDNKRFPNAHPDKVTFKSDGTVVLRQDFFYGGSEKQKSFRKAVESDIFDFWVDAEIFDEKLEFGNAKGGYMTISLRPKTSQGQPYPVGFAPSWT